MVVAGETFILGGDIIVKFDGRQISSIEQLRDAVAARKPGDKVKLVIYRGANRTSVTVTLGRQPQSPQGWPQRGPGQPGLCSLTSAWGPTACPGPSRPLSADRKPASAGFRSRGSKTLALWVFSPPQS